MSHLLVAAAILDGVAAVIVVAAMLCAWFARRWARNNLRHLQALLREAELQQKPETNAQRFNRKAAEGELGYGNHPWDW